MHAYISLFWYTHTKHPNLMDFMTIRGGLTQEDQEAVNKFSSLSHTGTTPGKEGDDSNMDTTRTRTPDNKHKS